MSATPRQWIGSTVVIAVSLVLAVLSVWAGFSHWLLLVLLAIAAAGLLVTWPGGDEPEGERSAFIRGDASGSLLEDVTVDGTDSFIEGNAIGTVLRRIVYRARGLNRAARRRKGR